MVWAGGATTKNRNPKEQYIEIDHQYGQALGLRDGQQVNVEFCKNISSGRSVNVEPLTIDDWEILELHAGYLEEQFLNQVRVVWKNQILTVWVHGQTIIRLKVVETDPDADCVLLDTNAEVIVAPKQRWTPVAKTENVIPSTSGRSLHRPSWPGRLLPTDAFNPSEHNIANEPDLPTICIPTVKEDSLPVNGSIVYLTKRDFGTQKKGPESEEAQSNGATEDVETATKPKGLYVHCRHVSSIPRGHVWANEVAQNLLSLHPFAKVRMHEHPRNASNKFKLSIRPVVASMSDNIVLRKNQADVDVAIKAVREYLHKITFHAGHTLLTDGTTHAVSVNLSTSISTHVVINILEEKSDSKDIGSKFPQFANLDANSVDHVVIELGSPAISVFEDIGTKDTVPHLAGIDDLLIKLEGELRSRIAKPIVRRSMKTPVQGGVLLYGARGSGKTSVVRAATRTMSLDLDVLAYSIFVNCVELATERVIKVKDILQETIYKAAWHSPSIVVFDDLDRLLPAEQEHADSSRSRQLTELFMSMMHSATNHFGIVLLATVQQRTSIHATLLTQHVFGELIHISPPGKQERQQILERMLQDTGLSNIKLSALNLSSIAGTTEGFSPADLHTLTQRAVHEAANRHLVARAANFSTTLSSSDMIGSEMQVATSDYVKAQKGFVPANLKGVKLEKGGEIAWSDVGGMRETKRMLLETLEWPTKYAAIFANCSLRLRSGLLLYGFPGCGKTLLASAVAKECGLNFISVKGPELLNKYIGASEQSVRDLFERASAAKPCVLFFDEFDAIAPRRGNDNTGVTDRVVNQMLTQMDGAEGLDGVYVLAATSRPDIIDPALLRPGRLDKSLLCGLPDEEERLEILHAVAAKLELDPAVSLADYAARTSGFSGADLQAVLYNAHLEAIHGVLDGADEEAKDGAGSTTVTTNGNTPGSSKHHDFIVVQRGEVCAMTHVEKGELAMKIEASQRTLAESALSSSSENSKANKAAAEQERPVITAANLETALRTTRPSISELEKLRLQRIYDAFLGGKGSTENPVGQRSTLA
ncbi:P-loop containing nucleoside triphosphate hydrolase protein [Powellomyces hirtus]|nr:P-loop containing nucleoside triphosphate hydrolase protein [Powellomyces hirtus]